MTVMAREPLNDLVRIFAVILEFVQPAVEVTDVIPRVAIWEPKRQDGTLYLKSFLGSAAMLRRLAP
jgi:hypothetical protein